MYLEFSEIAYVLDSDQSLLKLNCFCQDKDQEGELLRKPQMNSEKVPFFLL